MRKLKIKEEERKENGFEGDVMEEREQGQLPPLGWMVPTLFLVMASDDNVPNTVLILIWDD